MVNDQPSVRPSPARAESFAFDDGMPMGPALDSAAIGAAVPLEVQVFEVGPARSAPQSFARHCLLVPLDAEPVAASRLDAEGWRAVTLGPDDVAFVPAGLRTAWASRQPTRTAAVWIDPPALRRFAEHRMHVLLTGPEPREAGVLTDPELRRVALALCDALRADDPATAVLFESLAQIFVAVLVRRYAPQRETRPGSGLDAERFRRVAAHVEAHLAGRLSVDELAAVAAMSPSRFGHAFKAATGRTPHDFVTERRLERARVMLETEPVPISQVAAACGFADQAHLSRRFRAAYGATPLRWRKRVAGSAAAAIGAAMRAGASVQNPNRSVQ